MDTRRPVRRGEILLIPIEPEDKPGSLMEVGRDGDARLVLAEGETTGHCHAILDHPATLFCSTDVGQEDYRWVED